MLINMLFDDEFKQNTLTITIICGNLLQAKQGVSRMSFFNKINVTVMTLGLLGALPNPANASSVQEDAAAAEQVVRAVRHAVFEGAFEHLTMPACPDYGCGVQNAPQSKVPADIFQLFDAAFAPQELTLMYWTALDGIEHLHWLDSGGNVVKTMHLDIEQRPLPNYLGE